MGAERRTLVMTEDEKRLTAYHEGGHAMVAHARAVDRSGAQGDDHPARPRARHGHAAAGARPALHELRADDLAARHPDGRPRRRGDDLRRQARHVRRGVRHRAGDEARARHGDALGLLRRGRPRCATARTRRRSSSAIPSRGTQNVSEETAQKIDMEVRRLVDEGYEEARRILTEHAGRAGDPGAGPARVRDAVRRRDQGPPERQAPGARGPERRDTEHAARLRGAGHRPEAAPRQGRTPGWSRSRRPDADRASNDGGASAPPVLFSFPGARWI